MAKTRRSKQQSSSKDYFGVLDSYWDGRPQTSIERLSKTIADNPDHPDRFKLYRLWIEVLAHQNETLTLKSLVDHLHLLSVLEPEASAVFLALRGIAYLEIDDFEAAQLCFKGVQAVDGCDYCNELKFLVSQRINARMPYSDLVGRVNQLHDYFHLKIAGVIAHRANHPQLLEAVMKRTTKVFPKSPLLEELKLHTFFEQKMYAEAASSAMTLIGMYPANSDYYVYAGNAYLAAKKPKAAMDILEKAVAIGSDDDVDVLSLLVSAYTQVMNETGKDHEQGRKDRYLIKLNKALEDIGVKTHQTAEGKIHSLEEPKVWMAKLDEAEFFAVREARQDSITNVTRKVDKEATKGDLVFCVASDYRKPKKGAPQTWRLVAVYQLEANATWHPIDGFVASLTLLSRPEHSIPFDVRIEGEVSVKSGVIKLDIDAVDLITAAVQEHAESSENSVVLREIEKVRLSS